MDKKNVTKKNMKEKVETKQLEEDEAKMHMLQLIGNVSIPNKKFTGHGQRQTWWLIRVKSNFGHSFEWAVIRGLGQRILDSTLLSIILNL